MSATSSDPKITTMCNVRFADITDDGKLILRMNFALAVDFTEDFDPGVAVLVQQHSAEAMVAALNDLRASLRSGAHGTKESPGPSGDNQE